MSLRQPPLTLCISLLAWSLCASSVAGLTIHSVSQSDTTVGRYEPLFVYFGLGETTYTNPFDPREIDVSFEFTGPSGVKRVIPAFFYADISAGWQARIAPLEVGPHQCTIIARDDAGNIATAPVSFDAVASGNPGFLRIDSRDPRYMQFDDGTPYFPVGHNTCWNGHYSVHAQYLAGMGNVGENWTRYWMASYVGQDIEWGGDVEVQRRGLGTYSTLQSNMFDDMINNATNNGLYVQLCMDSFNGWNYSIYANWYESPYYVGNGGMLNEPMEYFTNAEAQRLARQRLRYIVSRWGYSTNILCWEFFNEVDIAGAGGSETFFNNTAEVVEWHRMMGEYIRSIDPFDHLRTTSFANDANLRIYDPFWELDEMDIVQVHQYHSSLPQAHIDIVRDAERFGKPVILGEGNDSGVPSITAGAFESEFQGAIAVPPFSQKNAVLAEYSDPSGQTLHDMIWGVAVAQSGAMSWWWDGWIHPNNLYGVFTPLVAYVNGEDFAAYDLQHADFNVVNGSSSLFVVGSSGSWDAFLWLRDTSGPVSDLQIDLNGMQPAKYLIEYWDTYSAGILSTETIIMSTSTLTLPIPTFNRDIAIKVHGLAPLLMVDPTEITFDAWVGNDVGSTSITLSNQSLTPMTFSITDNASWLATDTSAGTVDEQSATVNVFYSTASLSIGEHQAALTITSPDSLNSPITIPVLLNVNPHPADMDLDGDVDQSDYGLFQNCLDQPGSHYLFSYCASGDFNNDHDVDAADATIFRDCMTGEAISAEATCLPE